MAMSDCPDCWNTPCICGTEYKRWSDEQVVEQINMLKKVLGERPVPHTYVSPDEIQPIDIIIDFDGTVVKHAYPSIGDDIGAVPILQELLEHKHRLILFTMRSGFELVQAVNWFEQHNIKLYGVQKHPEQHTWTNSPKAYGQLHIDDAALGVPLVRPDDGRPYVNWTVLRELLVYRKLLPSN